MSIRRASKSSISTTSRGKGSNLIAGYSPAVDEMDLIQRVTVGSSGVSSVVLSSIPQTYQHLHIRYSTRANVASGLTSIIILFNGDNTEANYWRHVIAGSGYAPISSQFNTYMTYHYTTGTLGLANNFGAGYINITDYTSTTKRKTVSAVTGMNNRDTGSNNDNKGYVAISSGSWNSTAAVTSLTLNQALVENSVVSLYGVRG